MKKYLLRTENLILSLALLFFGICEILKYSHIVSFHFYQAYLIVPNSTFFINFFLYITLIYGGYYFLRHAEITYTKLLPVLQVIGLFSFSIFPMIRLWQVGLNSYARVYYDYGAWENFQSLFFMFYKLEPVISLFFVLSQSMLFIFIGYKVLNIYSSKH